MGSEFRIGDWAVQPELGTVTHNGSTVHLEPKIMEVLAYLARNRGAVVSKEQIFRDLWPDAFVTDDALLRCIIELRRIFQDDRRNPWLIQTIPKRGYRMIAPVEMEREAETAATPEFFGRYRVLREISPGAFTATDGDGGQEVRIEVLEENSRLAEHSSEHVTVLRSLNHPNVAAFRGVERENGRRFLITEFIRGETLADGLRRGRPAVREAIRTCQAVAGGLAAAHNLGIVHGNLGPEAVVITPIGEVITLDMGLWRLRPSALSKAGVSYRSPESSRGQQPEKSGDVWAFGCLLYECLTGRKAFQGDSPAETHARAREGEPDWSLLPPDTPPAASMLVRWCLEKDPSRRLREIADAHRPLAEALDALTAPAGEGRRQTWGRWGVWLGLLIVAVSAVSALIGWRVKPAPPAMVTRSIIDLPPGTQLTRDRLGPTRTEFALTPDGQHLVFSAMPDEDRQKASLYKLALSETEARIIPGTEGARAPFISPDGQWIGFWAAGNLARVAFAGGIPNSILESALIPFGAVWTTGGHIIVAASGDFALTQVDGKTGKWRGLTKLIPRVDSDHRMPQPLPDGKTVLFSASPSLFGVESRIDAVSLETGERRTVIEDAADARYVPTGHLVFMRDGSLMAVPFDPVRLRLHGPAVPVIKGVQQSANATLGTFNSRMGQYTFSNSGSLVYAQGGAYPDPSVSLHKVDRTGAATKAPWLENKPFLACRYSPDGTRVAYTTQGRDENIWILDLDRGTTRRLTSEGQTAFFGWSPDGNWIVFDQSVGGSTSLCRIKTDGSGPMERLLEPGAPCVRAAEYLKDGNSVLFNQCGADDNWDLWMFNLQTRESRPVLATKCRETFPALSPDGRRLAYTSNETGRYEVYVTDFPPPGRKVMISNTGGKMPVWDPSGNELYYLSFTPPRIRMMGARIRRGANLEVDRPRVLFECNAPDGGPIRFHDISPDGSHFLMPEWAELKPVEITRLVFVHNWFEELKRLAPRK